VTNLDTCKEVTVVYFYNGKSGNLLKKIADQVTIMIRVVGSVA